MDDFLKLAKVLGIVIGIILIGVVIGLIGTGGREVTISPTNLGGIPQSSATVTVQVAVASRVSPAAPPPTQVTNESVSVETQVVPPVPVTDLVTNWSEKLDDVLGSEKPDPEKARELLEIFPRTTKEGQIELASHLSNLVSDEDFPSFGRYLTNTALSEDVLDILLSDLLNRPDTLKLPTLVDVAKDPKNPKSGEAKDLLELYLEEDYGTDWPTWRSKVDKWLKENP